MSRHWAHDVIFFAAFICALMFAFELGKTGDLLWLVPMGFFCILTGAVR